MLMEFIEPYNRIACIGMSKIEDKSLENICIGIGFVLANLNKQIISGNANGADSLFAQGANLVNSKLVSLYLPEMNHNKIHICIDNEIFDQANNPEWAQIAAEYHSYYNYLTPYVKRLFNRNVGIILNSDCVIALPNMAKKGWGGTGHSMRIADAYGKPILNISKEDISYEIKALIRSYIND